MVYVKKLFETVIAKIIGSAAEQVNIVFIYAEKSADTLKEKIRYYRIENTIT